MVGQSVETKMNAFEDFMEDTIGVPVARALIIAQFYLPQLNDDWAKLVPVQPGMSWPRAQHALRATAWDLYLASMSEQLAGSSNDGVCDVSFFCTQERALARA